MAATTHPNGRPRGPATLIPAGQPGAAACIPAPATPAPWDWLTTGHPLSETLAGEYRRRLAESVRGHRRYSLEYFLEEVRAGLYRSLLASGTPDEFTPSRERS